MELAEKKKILMQVVALHAEADMQAERIIRKLENPLLCKRGCTECCVDDLTVFEIEALRIEEEYPEVLAGQQPGPVGACAFLDDEGSCRIYDARPYVCRTQGLPLRWLDEDGDTLVEYRDICPVNDGVVALIELDADDCFTLGPLEKWLRQIQDQCADDPLPRISLRSMFKMKDSAKE